MTNFAASLINTMQSTSTDCFQPALLNPDIKKVVVGMSGGIDSTAVAYLLKQSNYDVIGISMKLWQERGKDELSSHGGCCDLDALSDARRACSQMQVPFYVMNFKQSFEKEVVDYFVREYQAGRTPNPCIICNQKLKWEGLLQRSKMIGAQAIATGHYARIKKLPNGRLTIQKALYLEKDQSYVLYSLSQENLARTLFPLGEYKKQDVRSMMAAAGFTRISRKKDSEDICFVTEGTHADFIAERSQKKAKTGNFVDTNGNILGRHKGLVNYTVGQRRGLNIALGYRAYVLELRPLTNEVVLGTYAESLKSVFRTDLNKFMAIEKLTEAVECNVKIRYNQKPVQARLVPLNDLQCEVHLSQAVSGIAPGQSAVFYWDDYILGGGIITEIIE